MVLGVNPVQGLLKGIRFRFQILFFFFHSINTHTASFLGTFARIVGMVAGNLVLREKEGGVGKEDTRSE